MIQDSPRVADPLEESWNTEIESEKLELTDHSILFQNHLKI